MLKRLFYLFPASVLAFAQEYQFDAESIVNNVKDNVIAIAGAGVVLLGLVLGITAAWKYARRFLKG